MKNKKGLLLTGTFVTLLSLASCGNQRVDMSKWEFLPKNPENINIGILLPVHHDALESSVEGFKAGLALRGYIEGSNVSFNEKNADGSDSDRNTFAKNLIISEDLTLGVGTSAAQSLYSQSINLGKSNPILFTAVTDAVSAQLVDNNQTPGQYVTGTSDDNPVEAQIALLKEALPSATKVGIFYTQSEVNSKVQADKAKAQIEKLGMTAFVQTCMGTTDLVQNLQALVTKVDAIYIPTDNNCAAHMPEIAANCGNKLLVVGEENVLPDGGHLTLSVNYYELGVKTAHIAADIMDGVRKPNVISVETMSVGECALKYSSVNCAACGISLPQSIIDRGIDIDEE